MKLSKKGAKKMLKPAQLYAEKLREAELKSWYKPENIYYDGGTGAGYINLPENNYNKHCFVSVDDGDNVIGFISYRIDWPALSADGFSAISYKKGSLEFGRGLYKAICDIFYKYNLNRMSWCCFADNPAVKGYRNFIRLHGGRECAYFRQIARLQDGKLHDSVDFEIVASEFKGRIKGHD